MPVKNKALANMMFIDDGTLLKASAPGSVLSFTPKASSYIFESFPCETTQSSGYSALQFMVLGPKGGELSIELQSKASCSETSYSSKYVSLPNLTGNLQIITLPWNQWPGANGDAISGIVWYGFKGGRSDTEWKMANIQFVCGSGGPSPPAPIGPNDPFSAPRGTQNLPARTTPAGALPTFKPQAGECPLVVEDFVSQSRLTFLFYNALLQPSSDDATMQSVTLQANKANRVILTPKDRSSYWYTQFGCLHAVGKYGGISLRIKAPADSDFTVQLGYNQNCGDPNPKTINVSTRDLGWQFDGSEKLYSLRWPQFRGIDATKLNNMLITQLNSAITIGPISMFCGDQATDYIPPTTSTQYDDESRTMAAPTGRASPVIIDRFASPNVNSLGFWHGADEGMLLSYGNGQLTISSNDPDYTFNTQIAAGCVDWTFYDGDYLHIVYSGTTKFSIAMQQHNPQCDEKIKPYPETWDEVEASRYAKNGHIYVPLSHFNIEKSRTLGFALKAWYDTAPTTFSLLEVVQSVPHGWTIPSKRPTGNLVFACKRPNSFAFCIDDGDPALAQEVMRIVKEENIKVTFFTVGAPLLDPSTNLTNVYKDMQSQGHQIALHSYTHPKMEGLADYGAIDWEYNNDVAVVGQVFNNMQSPYFRPPFGTEGARMRWRWTAAAGRDDASIVMWTVDVEDWIWAMGDTPEKQLAAFKRDVDKGGNLVVMHYLYKSTVGYLREFIQYAKQSGKQLMRLDQCMMDPK